MTGKRAGLCRCGARLDWVQTAAGEWTPLEDGENHWARCPYAEDFRRARKAEYEKNQLSLFPKEAPKKPGGVGN